MIKNNARRMPGDGWGIADPPWGAFDPAFRAGRIRCVFNDYARLAAVQAWHGACNKIGYPSSHVLGLSLQHMVGQRKTHHV